MRTLTPVLLAVSLAAALAQSAASLTIDNFEQGAFNFADDTTTPSFTGAEQSGLLTANVVGGVRLVRNFASGTVGVATAAFLVETPADDSASFSYTGDGVGEFQLIYDGIPNGQNDVFSGLLGLDLSAFSDIQIDATAASVTANVELQFFTSSNSQSSTVALVNGATLIPLGNFPLVNLSDIRAIRVILSGIDPGESPLITNIAAVPEPATGLLVAAGMVAMAVARKRA